MMDRRFSKVILRALLIMPAVSASQLVIPQPGSISIREAIAIAIIQNRQQA